jgi:hypothetical protein
MADLNSTLIILLYSLPILLAMTTVLNLVVGRLRNENAANPDRQVGRKSILHMFLTTSLTIGLLAATMLSCEAFHRILAPMGGSTAGPAKPVFDAESLPMLAFSISGFGHAVLIWACIRYVTNDREHPAVGRSHLGVRTALAGLVVICNNTYTSALMVQSPVQMGSIGYAVGLAVVWVPTLLIHGWLLCRPTPSPSPRPTPNDEPGAG